MNDGRVGVAVVDITPLQPIPLSGFANRAGVFTGIHTPLQAKIFAIEDGEGRKAMVVCGDLLGWDRWFVTAARRLLRRQFGKKVPALVLNASHTHSAPGALRRALPSLGGLEDSYRDYLLQRLAEGFTAAWQRREKAQVRQGVAVCEIGIHRRRERDGELIMAPNPEGPVDNVVTVVEFVRPSGDSLGGWVHYTCHPTTKNDLLVSAEYCGVGVTKLEESVGAPFGFLQGCCGDIKPRLLSEAGDRFRPGKCEDVEALGEQLFAAATAARNHAGAPEQISLSAASRVVRLACDPVLSDRELENLNRNERAPDYQREWAAQRLAEARRPGYAAVGLTGLRVSATIGLLGLAAEPSVEFGLFIRAQSRHRLLPLGYTNGIVGYVTTRQQLKQGGYEPLRSYYYFGLPGPFAPSSEKWLKYRLSNLIKELI